MSQICSALGDDVCLLLQDGKHPGDSSSPCPQVSPGATEVASPGQDLARER